VVAGFGHYLLINFTTNHAAAIETAQQCLKRATKPIRAEAFRADISRSADRAALVAFCRKSFAGVDLLVNNAGVAPEMRADILEASEESFDRLIAINVKGPYFLTQLVAQWMIEQSTLRNAATEDGRAGKIVTITSVSAYAASTNRGDYCIAKAALSMITPLYAARLAEHGIRVYEIRPGIIETDMTAPVKAKYDKLIAQGLTPLPRWGTPADVGKAVAAIAQDLLPFSTGEVINVDGGFHIRTL
jgi:3-oxoacyl-[acyl-carrier protein] reductase